MLPWAVKDVIRGIDKLANGKTCNGRCAGKQVNTGKTRKHVTAGEVRKTLKGHLKREDEWSLVNARGHVHVL